AAAEAGFIIQAGELEALLERLHGAFEIFIGGHGGSLGLHGDCNPQEAQGKASCCDPNAEQEIADNVPYARQHPDGNSGRFSYTQGPRYDSLEVACDIWSPVVLVFLDHS